MTDRARVLLIEDNPADADLLRELFSSGQSAEFELEHCGNLTEGIAASQGRAPDLVLLDLGLPETRGLQTLRRFLAATGHRAVLVLAEVRDSTAALEAVQAGAQDYLLKRDLNEDMLFRVLRYARERGRLILDLEEERDRSRMYLDLAGSLIVFLDREGRIGMMNKTAWQLLCPGQSAPIGQNWFDLFVPEQVRAERWSRFRTSVASPDEEGSYEGELCSLSGVRLLVQWTFRAVRGGAPEDIVGLLLAGMDITERHVLEQELRESEERLRIIFENAPDAIYLLDDRGRFLDANRQAEQMLGDLRENWIGRSALESGLLAPLDVERARSDLEASVQGESVPPAVFELRRPDGRRLQLEISTFPVQLQTMNCILAIARDLTERIDYERRLALRAAALNAASNGILITDTHGTIVWCNRAICEMTGYDQKELVGAHTRILKSGRQESATYAKLWQTVLSGVVWQGELINRRKDGSEYFEEMSITPIPDDQGVVQHFVAVKQDVTERVRSREELSASEARFRYIFDRAPSGMLELDIAPLRAAVAALPGDGARNGAPLRTLFDGVRVTDANASALGIFSFEEPADFVGRHFSELFHDELCLRKMVRALQNNDEHCSSETRILRKGESVRYTRATAYLPPATASSLLALLSLVDITEVKEMEQQLQQAAKMATLGEMATGMAHELNQPLSVISMGAQMLEMGARDGDVTPEFLLDQAGKIRSNIARATVIINHLRVFGRKAEPVRQVFELGTVVRSAMELVEQRLRQHNIKVDQVLPEPGLPILGDPNSMEQVFVNMLINAVDALEEREADRHVRVVVSDEGRNVRARVWNNGPPIPVGVIPRLFEPFFTTKPSGKGTGLGLSICYTIIKNHDGSIAVSNQADGVSFDLVLPRAEQKKG
ncbi:MAG: PAS domain S-box protein [Spirochaetales bacterium]|nr:PAS domain S-box protein [Leptospiraceae bacterium]MCP5481547.1 PAS domain S-box protein [Spirochaetales bacterium]MCP5484375.1 PAS domain S-box protein [Spirochaetales bacterium]